MFVEKRKIWYIISLVIIIPGIISMFMRGLNLGIDFTGGTVFDIRTEQSVKVDDVRASLNKMDLGKGAMIQKAGKDEFIIRTVDMSQADSDKVISNFRADLKKVEVLRVEKVGPVFGRELTMKAIYSMLIACVLMLIYITIRFEFKFGVGAVLALIHDALMVLGLFSLFQWEVDSTFVAAILTILGYSINDTIVIFDRVRENLRGKRKEDLATLADKSIWQTLTRSINTVLTVIFVLIALLIFGGETIKWFVVALLIGVASGCYSSIFIATPIWYDLKVREGAK